MSNIYPSNYESKLSLIETQEAIVDIKNFFQARLSLALGLKRVSAPIFVDPNTGLNDNLSGLERAVNFEIKGGTTLEIVQSLAKWKRFALKEYNITGLFTDMNAIRKNEDLDNLHSIYVDQWDWEKVIYESERNRTYLESVVCKIYSCLKETEGFINNKYPVLSKKLPDQLTFITSEELLEMYPGKTPKEREYLITKDKGAVFVIGIGSNLSNGEPHDTRASDYDDWTLNGDLLLYDEVLDVPFEITSMGIRVDAAALMRQLAMKHENDKLTLPYHKAVINNELPLTIGGGIGQSRLCMYLLEKAHIGEVQSSYWSDRDKEEFAYHNIKVL